MRQAGTKDTPERNKQGGLSGAKRTAWLAAAGLALAACTPEDFAFPGGGAGAVTRSVSLMEGDLVVAGPSGFCVDTDLSDPASRFVVLAGCDVISRGAAVGPAKKGILMITTSEDRSGEGVTARQVAATVDATKILDTMTSEGVALVQLSSGGEALVPGGEPRYWRGVAVVNGYLVVMTALSRQGGSASTRDGAQLLINTAQRMTVSSPNRPLPIPPDLRPETPPKAAPTPPKGAPRQSPVPPIRPGDLDEVRIAGL